MKVALVGGCWWSFLLLDRIFWVNPKKLQVLKDVERSDESYLKLPESHLHFIQLRSQIIFLVDLKQKLKIKSFDEEEKVTDFWNPCCKSSIWSFNLLFWMRALERADRSFCVCSTSLECSILLKDCSFKSSWTSLISFSCCSFNLRLMTSCWWWWRHWWLWSNQPCQLLVVSSLWFQLLI